MRRGLLPAILVLLCPSVAAAWTIDHPVYDADLTVTDADVAPYLGMSEAELRAMITPNGPVADPSNATAKQAAYDLARMHQKTQQSEYADRAVILLERFAEVMPSWPVYSNDGTLVAVPVTDTNVWTRWSARGLWNTTFHLDLEEAAPLALAYDFVASSGAVEARSAQSGIDVAALIEDDLLRYSVEVALRFEENGIDVGGLPAVNHAYGNLSGYMHDGMIVFARVAEPAFVHILLPRMRDQLWVGFFRDGAWREGTPSYHRQTVGLSKKNETALAGYSDPAGFLFEGYTTRFGDVFDGTSARYDDLVPYEGLEVAWERAKVAMDPVTLPTGDYFVIHDTHTEQYNWEYQPTEARSHCLFGMRHCVMGRFADDDQVYLHFHFGGTDGHEHYDALNLGLWALGTEVLSEGEYKNFGNVDWNLATAGHNTVIVDEKNQNGRFANRLPVTVDDAVDAIGFYRYQDYGQGDSRNFGNLRLWDATRPELMVVEASGENAYADDTGTVSAYRRTIAMIEIEGTSFYVVDVFRVKGGQTHDWMLHGRLDEDYDYDTTLDLVPASGERYGYLTLGEQAITAEAWTGDFLYGNGTHLRTTMMGHPGTEVSLGRAPAQRRDGQATFVDVRRVGGESVFVAVHEPYAATPAVTSVRSLADATTVDSMVAIEVELQSGRTDVVAATLDQAPYPPRAIPGTDIELAGRFAHVAKEGQELVWMALHDGASLRAGGVELEAASGDFGHHGTITDVHRIAKGDAENAFVTATSLPATLLAGKTLLLELPDGRTEGYIIEEVIAQSGATSIRVQGDPGIELRDSGALIKHVYFPHHGLRGTLGFFIPGSVHRDRDGNVTATAPLTSDPLADGGVPSDGGPKTDGGPQSDAGVGDASFDGGAPKPGAAPSEDDGGGCGCRVQDAAQAPRGWAAAYGFLFALLAGWGRRRRPRRVGRLFE